MNLGPIHQRLKAASRLLVRAIGTVEASAEITGKSHSQIGRYQHIDQSDFMPIDVVVTLEGQPGVPPHVTQALAALNGHILVACPPLKAESAPWFAQIASLASEAGSLMSGLADALGDGKITADEIKRKGLRTEVAELQSVLASIDFGLAQIERGEPGT